MTFIRKRVSFLSLFMVAITLLVAVPYQPLLAAMVPTDCLTSEPSRHSQGFY
jgi:hypothetical protein